MSIPDWCGENRDDERARLEGQSDSLHEEIADLRRQLAESRAELARVKALLDDWTEGDRWQKRATMFLESGNCPVCFGDDEGGHRNDCPWGQAETHADRLADALRRYGRHEAMCHALAFPGPHLREYMPKCDCGLEEALARKEEGK